MTPTALLCDTGALLDYLVATAPDHRAFRDAIDGARTRYIPGLVLAEVDYFLRKDRRAMGALIRDLSRGAFTYAPPSSSTLDRAMGIDRQYGDLRLGLVDASIVALAEEVFVHRLVTRDVRHFSSVRLRGGRRFDLVVQPRRPER
jgi:predicted nucleic acid-binding protein